MKLYVVVDERLLMGSKEVIAIFSGDDDAERFLLTLDRKIFPGAYVESHKVIGRYEYPAEVFAAQELHADVFYFKGLFADYDSAKRATEERPRTFKPDSRMIASSE